MKKDDGIVKKTQEALHDKVVPAAREGLEKGSTIVSGILKDTGKKAGELVEAAGEKTREVGKALGERSERVLPNKNDSIRHFKKEAESLGHKAGKVKDQIVENSKETAESAIEFAKHKTGRVKKDVSSNADLAVKKADKIIHPGKGKKIVRNAAGIVVLAAAAAAGYAYYKKRLEEDEAIKAEFSEKMKKWNELEGDELADAGNEHPVRMKVRPGRVYQLSKNALLGEDIIVNISASHEGFTEFNPDDLSEPVNTVEEFRKKAGVIAGKTSEKAREVAEKTGEKAREVAEKTGEKAKEVVTKTSEKARQAAGTVSDKAKGVYHAASDKVEEVYEDASDRVEEVYEDSSDKIEELKGQDLEIRHEKKQSFGADDIPRFRNEPKDTWQSVGSSSDEVKETKDLEEGSTENSWRTEEEIDEVSRHTDKNIPESNDSWQVDEEIGVAEPDSLDNGWETVDPGSDMQENKMESDDSDKTPEDDLWEKDESGFEEDWLSDNEDPLGENISWDEDESVLMQKTEDLRRKGAEGYRLVKDKVTEAKDFVVDKYHEMKAEDEDEFESELFNEEFQVTIHNRGNKDYFFSPMLIQRYNSRKRVTTPVPAHEEGTTLEQRIIKPGETYSGRIVLKKTYSDDALIMFEDLLMKNSVAILLEEELDDDFLMEEGRDLNDDLLFEGIEGDLEDYEFADEEMTQLDDLDIEETEELDFDYTDDEPIV